MCTCGGWLDARCVKSLDQCVAFHFGEKLTYDNVLEVLGAVDNRVFSKLFQAVLASDTRRASVRLRK